MLSSYMENQEWRWHMPTYIQWSCLSRVLLLYVCSNISDNKLFHAHERLFKKRFIFTVKINYLVLISYINEHFVRFPVEEATSHGNPQRFMEIMHTWPSYVLLKKLNSCHDYVALHHEIIYCYTIITSNYWIAFA